ncbi:BrnT family toxin [soil metagenome]
MDRTFKLRNLEFEWDDEKYAVNLRKHSIKFEEAEEVFFDPEQEFGDASVDEEVRQFVIGCSVSRRILLVVFIERGFRTPIISARRATRQERKEYEE